MITLGSLACRLLDRRTMSIQTEHDGLSNGLLGPVCGKPLYGLLLRAADIRLFRSNRS